MLGPRPIRLVGFASIVLLQILIALTGNYGFFNLLTVVICLTMLDDRDWDWLQRTGQRLLMRTTKQAAGDERPYVATQTWSWPRRVSVGVAGVVILAVTGSQTLETVAPDVVIPAELVTLNHGLEPFRSMNNYGLFAVMTTIRPEIMVEGSDDGLAWNTYRFRWKPGTTDDRPRLAFLHLPRLDWQMWFAALAGDCRAAPWFFRFEQRLLEGSPAVLGLLAQNPFSDHPPRYVRSVVSLQICPGRLAGLVVARREGNVLSAFES